MGIINNAGTSFSDQQIRDFFATNPNADQVASQAASMGLTRDQIQQGMAIGNYGGATEADRYKAIDSYANPSGYQWDNQGQLSSPGSATPNASSGIIGGPPTGKYGTNPNPTSGPGSVNPNVGTSYGNGYGAQNPNAGGGSGVYANGKEISIAEIGDFLKNNPLQTVDDMSKFYNWGHSIGMSNVDMANLRSYAREFYGFNPNYGYGAQYNPNAGVLVPGSGGASGGTGGAGGSGGAGGISGSGSSSSSSSSSGGTPGSGTTVPWNVTPEQTVEGRVAGILAGDGPLLQQARARAQQDMIARGTQNSSMATTAADLATYQAAVPIATADAATFGKAAGYNADQTNQFTTNDLNRKMQMQISQLNSDTSKYIAQLDNAQKTAALDVQTKNSTLLNTNSQAAQAFNTAMNAVNAIQQNNQMDANTKTQAIGNVWHDVQSQLAVLGATSGLNLTATLNFANYPGFDSQGKWIGFGASTVAIPPTTQATALVSPADNGNAGGE